MVDQNQKFSSSSLGPSHETVSAKPHIPDSVHAKSRQSVTRQAPLSIGFSRQEYWSGLPYSPPGDLHNPGTEPTSLMSPALAGGFFTTSTTWEAQGSLSTPLFSLPSRTSPSAVGPAVLGCEKQLKKNVSKHGGTF